MATAIHEATAKLSLHRVATARTRALHNDDRLYEAVVEVMQSGKNMTLTPREELKRRS